MKYVALLVRSCPPIMAVGGLLPVIPSLPPLSPPPTLDTGGGVFLETVSVRRLPPLPTLEPSGWMLFRRHNLALAAAPPGGFEDRMPQGA